MQEVPFSSVMCVGYDVLIMCRVTVLGNLHALQKPLLQKQSAVCVRARAYTSPRPSFFMVFPLAIFRHSSYLYL
jgi:hypothetical protein